jgi:hypothetical protein
MTGDYMAIFGICVIAMLMIYAYLTEKSDAD